MSRYDGLIIPRSYSEYINKTDAATLQQALQLSGVLSGAVAAGDNKAVKSSAVNVALENEKKTNYNATITDCNNAYAEESMSRYVLNGTITSNLPDTTSIYIVESISSNSSISGNNYGYQIATKIGNISNNGDRYIRYRNSANKTWGNWKKVTTETDLSNFAITKFSRPNEMWGYYTICGNRCFIHIKFILTSKIADWGGIAPTGSVPKAKTPIIVPANGKTGSVNSIYLDSNGYISQGGGGGMNAGTYEFDFDYEIL